MILACFPDRFAGVQILMKIHSSYILVKGL